MLLDQGHQLFPLRGRHLAVRESAVILRLGFALIRREDVARGAAVDDRLCELLLVQRVEQRKRKILLRGQRTRTRQLPFLYMSGIRAKELRRRSDRLAIDDGPVLREVVPLVTPAPGRAWLGIAEDGEVIELRVADDAAGFHFAEHILERADGLGLFVAAF